MTRSPIDQQWPKYRLGYLCPFAESEIARPKWMDAMIRKWMYSTEKPPLRQRFSYPIHGKLVGTVSYATH